jgi:hypothetical protein
MSIILRTNKGSALTYDEMDRNQSQFYYSSSISPDGTKIRLHFTGSDNLDLATEDYGPNRYHEVQFPSADITVPDAIAAGNNTQIQFNDNDTFGTDSVFVYNKTENYLGVGTSNPLDRVDIQGDGNKGGSISLRGFSAGSGETKHAKVNFNEGSTFIGRIGRTDPNNYNLYITNNYSAGGELSDTYSKVKVAIGEATDDESRVVSTFAKIEASPRFGVGMGSVDPNRQGTFVGALGIGISNSTNWDADQSFLAPIPSQIFSSTNGAGRHDLIPNNSDSSGLLISSPKDANGGNIVVAINTDTTNKNEGFNIINAFGGSYTNSEVIASFQASGKVGINTNFPSVEGLTVAGIISGSGNANIDGNVDGGGTLNIAGNSTLGGTLEVTGATALNGGLTMDTNKFTVADGTGNTGIAGTLTVQKATTLSNTLNVTGAVTAGSTINATGTITGNKIIKTGGTNQQILLANGDVTTIGAVTAGSVITNTGASFNTTRGYQKFSTGLIIQFGYQSGGTVTFPVAFPNKCISVTCSTERGGSGSRGYNHVHNVTKTGCSIVLDGSYGRWMAMGY